MKKVLLFIICLAVLLCCCSCSEDELLEKIYESFEYEFECEFDVECSDTNDFSEFERALPTIEATIQEKTQVDANTMHYVITAPAPAKDSVFLLSTFGQTDMICGENGIVASGEITKCWMENDFFAVVEAGDEFRAKIENCEQAYLKPADSDLVYDVIPDYEEDKCRLRIFTFNYDDRPILTAWVYSINGIRFKGSVQISNLEERKTKQAFHLFG